MEGYQGETPIVVSECPKHSKFTQSDWALLFIRKYGGIDGAHHKSWVLDQVSRILCGTPVIVTQASWANGETEFRYQVAEPTAQYWTWRDALQGATDVDGNREYSYEEGIAP